MKDLIFGIPASVGEGDDVWDEDGGEECCAPITAITIFWVDIANREVHAGNGGVKFG